MAKSCEKPKFPETRKVERAPVHAATAARQVLESFALIPLHMLAEGRNQTIPSLLHDLTGLSKARISNGNIDAVRPSTLKKMDEHQQRWLEKRLDDPEALAYAHEKIATTPQTKSGKYAPWAGWVHQLETLPEVPLPEAPVQEVTASNARATSGKNLDRTLAQLERINKLRNEGALTEEEFLQIKVKLIQESQSD